MTKRSCPAFEKDIDPIRKFHVQDLRRILRIEREAFAADAWPGDLFGEYAAMWPTFFLVAPAGVRIAGYSIACPTRGGAELASIAVAARYRGKGIATALIRATIRKLKRTGVKALWLTVRPDNRDAIQLYRRIGFMRKRTVRGYYEDGSDGWRMCLALSG